MGKAISKIINKTGQKSMKTTKTQNIQKKKITKTRQKRKKTAKKHQNENEIKIKEKHKKGERKKPKEVTKLPSLEATCCLKKCNTHLNVRFELSNIFFFLFKIV